MALYLSQWLPLRDEGSLGETVVPFAESIDAEPQIELFLVLNPTRSEPGSESIDELSKQIDCCISPEYASKWTIEVQTNIVGVIQGLESLSQSMSQTADQDNWLFDCLETRVVVQKVEPDFYIACCVSFSKSYLSNKDVTCIRLAKNIQHAHGYYSLLNSSLSNLEREYNLDVLKLTLSEFWATYVTSYNRNGCEAMNHKGVLGLLPNSRPLYKRSTCSLGQSVPDLMNLLAESTCLKEVGPSAVLISCFDQTAPKKYGSMYMGNIGLNTVCRDSLTLLYNLMEYLEFSGRLQDLCKLSNKTMFSMDGNDSADAVVESTRLAQAFDLLNPVYLANNLVVLPVTYTVSGVRNTFNQEHWLPSWMGGAREETVQEDIEEDEDANLYLTGPDCSLIVYLNTADGHRQLRLVMFHNRKSGINITLAFDASLAALNQRSFYQQLATEVLELAIDDIGAAVNVANLGNSLSSLPQSLSSINSRTKGMDVDSNFFFINYDPKGGAFKSSLPYLPRNVNPISSNLRGVIGHLHNLLADILLARRENEFFTPASTEYFHKFAANRYNDWMLYYVKYQEKYIIIIKNHSKISKRRKQAVPEIPPSLLAQVTSGVYDYAPLGFLDNLGDDIKMWLEKLTTSEG